MKTSSELPTQFSFQIKNLKRYMSTSGRLRLLFKYISGIIIIIIVIVVRINDAITVAANLLDKKDQQTEIDVLQDHLMELESMLEHLVKI